MERTIKTTEDGSKTLYISNMDESYHSQHGALNEAKHVFIKNGLNLINICDINILELGFGTGLNLLVSFDEFLKTDKNQVIHYFSLEKYPVTLPEIETLQYDCLFANEKVKTAYYKIHDAKWDTLIELAPNFYFKKIKTDFFNLPEIPLPPIHLVYYDCFGAHAQPDLWEEKLFNMVTDKMQKNGLLTTYSSKGSVRRILKSLGFTVEKKPGPPGKREMINALLNHKEA